MTLSDHTQPVPGIQILGTVQKRCKQKNNSKGVRVRERLYYFLTKARPSTPEWYTLRLVYFDSSYQHSEVHNLDWKCDVLTVRFHISSS